MLLKGGAFGGFVKLLAIAGRQILKNRYLLLAGLVTAFSLTLTGWIASSVFDRFPNSADEFAYLFQAQTYLDGKLWSAEHPLHSFFEAYHIYHGEGRCFSKYPPMWPALLALGMLLHIPAWMVNPILGIASLGIVYLIARRRFNERTAWISVLTLFTAPFFLFNSASYFSHTACAFFILLFCWFILKYESHQKWFEAVMAGCALGAAFQTRYFTAALTGGVLLIYFLCRRPLRWKQGIAWIGAGFFPWLLFFLFYNQMMTGSPWVTPFQFYDAFDRIGFFNTGPYPHTFYRALIETGVKWNYLSRWTGGTLGYLYLLSVAWKIIRKDWHFTDLILAALIVGHALHWATGTNQYGPRYYYEGFALAVISVAGTLFGKREDQVIGGFLRKICIFLFFAGLVFGLIKIPLNAEIVRENIQSRQDLYRQVRNQNLHNAVVLVGDVGVDAARQRRDREGLIRDMPRKDLIRNDLYFENDVLYALDLGLNKNVHLMRYYPDKAFYLYTREKDSDSGKMVPVKQSL